MAHARPGTDPHSGPTPARTRHPSGRRHRDLPEAERLRARVESAMRSLWMRHRRAATADYLASYLHLPDRVADIASAMLDPATIVSLRADGVIPDDDLLGDGRPSGSPYPTPTQVKAVAAFLDMVVPGQVTSLREALGEVGVTVRQWNGWLRDPVFVAYLRDVAGNLFGDFKEAMDAALLNRALSGDVAAIKLVMTATGRLAPEHAVDPNVLVARLLEVLVRRVGDAALLEVLAEDLKGLAATASPRPLELEVER